MDPSEDTREQTTDETPELTKELTYEEEQLQMFLIQEAKRKQIADQRELREQQDREYNESLKQETDKETKEHEIIQAEPTRATATAARPPWQTALVPKPGVPQTAANLNRP